MLRFDHGACGTLRSLAGKLSIIKEAALRARFENAKDANAIAALAHEFVAGIESNKCAFKFCSKASDTPRHLYRGCVLLRSIP